MANDAPVARPASTVLLARDRAGSIEVFMMVRHHQIEFASGALVFPGGSVDAGDRDIVADAAFYDNRDSVASEALPFRVAAIRETFEESGILLARRRGSDELIGAAQAGEIAQKHRAALCSGEMSFRDVLAADSLVLALDQLVHYAHWITPVGLPKRFDTHFFLAKAPPEQLGAHDGRESTDSIWVSPREAVEGGANGRFKLPFPTTRNLIKLSRQNSVDAALAEARRAPVVTVMPQITREGDRPRLRIPADAGYDGELFDMPPGG